MCEGSKGAGFASSWNAAPKPRVPAQSSCSPAWVFQHQTANSVFLPLASSKSDLQSSSGNSCSNIRRQRCVPASMCLAACCSGCIAFYHC